MKSGGRSRAAASRVCRVTSRTTENNSSVGLIWTRAALRRRRRSLPVNSIPARRQHSDLELFRSVSPELTRPPQSAARDELTGLKRRSSHEAHTPPATVCVCVLMQEQQPCFRRQRRERLITSYLHIFQLRPFKQNHMTRAGSVRSRHRCRARPLVC